MYACRKIFAFGLVVVVVLYAKYTYNVAKCFQYESCLLFTYKSDALDIRGETDRA